jgi:hypothetical protein
MSNLNALEPTRYLLRLQGKYGSEEESRDFDLGVGALPVSLGRAPNRTEGEPPFHLTLDASDSLLSREHVKIEGTTGRYEIVCLSKNGAVVDKKKVLKGARAPIKHQTAVRIGGCRFYVVFPVDPSSSKKRKGDGEGAPKYTKRAKDLDNLKDGEKVSYNQMIDECFKAGEVEIVSGGATQKDLVDWILVRFKSNISVSVGSIKKGVYSILNRHYERVEYYDAQYTEHGKTPPIRWKPKAAL